MVKIVLFFAFYRDVAIFETQKRKQKKLFPQK